MNGLNKIIDEIIMEAEVQAAKIVASAAETANENSAKVRAEHEVWKQEFSKPIKQECDRIIKHGESSDRQKRRSALLNVRNQSIDEIIMEAKSKITKLPDEEYFELLFRLFEKNAQPMDGIICFAEAEYAKIPLDFIDRCGRVFPENTIKLSESNEEIRNGFIIKYGNIIQNCSIDSIFESNKQSFRDKVNEYLMQEVTL